MNYQSLLFVAKVYHLRAFNNKKISLLHMYKHFQCPCYHLLHTVKEEKQGLSNLGCFL